jgi:hypothetical protein
MIAPMTWRNRKIAIQTVIAHLILRGVHAPRAALQSTPPGRAS